MESERRARAAELDDEVANLGVDLIAKGACELIDKHEENIETLEKSNAQPSKTLDEKIAELSNGDEKNKFREKSNTYVKIIMEDILNPRESCRFSRASLW